jgi:hypothetical protein
MSYEFHQVVLEQSSMHNFLMVRNFYVYLALGNEKLYHQKKYEGDPKSKVSYFLEIERNIYFQ